MTISTIALLNGNGGMLHPTISGSSPLHPSSETQVEPFAKLFLFSAPAVWQMPPFSAS